METIERIAERVQSAYSKGVKSDDTRLSTRHIYNVISSVRKRLLVNKANKSHSLDQSTYATIPFIKMIPVSSVECDTFSHLGCTIYRSEKKLPNILESKFGFLIEWVMPLDKKYTIDRVNRDGERYSQFAKFTAKRKRYVIESDYLYIINIQSPKALTLRAVFSDSVQYHLYIKNTCGKKDCLPLPKKSFFIDSSEEDTLIKMASQELIEIFYRMIEDKTNNNQDSRKEKSK